MRLRDRLSAALQTFREAPDLRSRLNEVEFELKIADQALELREKECDRLRDIILEGKMGKDFVYVQFDISREEHMKLKLRAAAQDCSLKSLLQEAVASYVQAMDTQQDLEELSRQTASGETLPEAPFGMMMQ